MQCIAVQCSAVEPSRVESRSTENPAPIRSNPVNKDDDPDPPINHQTAHVSEEKQCNGPAE